MGAGGIQVYHRHSSATEAEPLGDQPVELGEPEGVVAEELGHRVQAPVGEAQAVRDHRLEGLTNAHLALGEVLWDQLIDQLADAEFAEHPRDQTEVLQRLALVCLCIAHSSEHGTSLIPEAVGRGCGKPVSRRGRKKSTRPLG